LGLALAALTRDLLVSFAAQLTPLAAEINIDRTVLLFAVAASGLTGLLVGVVPALRTSTLMPATSHRLTARQALVATQVAISFVLLVGAGLMARSFANLQRADAGFNPDHVLTTRVDLDWVKYDTAEKRQTFFGPLVASLNRLPGATHAALSLTLPLSSSTPYNTEFLIEREGTANERPRPQADIRLVTPAYFDTMGMTLVRGRTFDGDDAPAGGGAAIVNLSLAHHRFAEGDTLGRRISVDGGKHWLTIVGVVNDVKQYGLAGLPVDELYLPFDKYGLLAANILVRTSGDPMAMLQAVTNASHEIDPRQPLSRPQTLDQVRSRSLSSTRLTTLLVSLLAFLALAITAGGIAGVAAFSINQRRFEIGVRIALGAPGTSVVGMVVKQALQPVAIGLVCGVAGSLVLTRAASLMLYAIRPTDIWTYVAVTGALGAVAAMACFAPARRAASIDPTSVLRVD
jgi:putative ABC transport system permease protein